MNKHELNKRWMATAQSEFEELFARHRDLGTYAMTSADKELMSQAWNVALRVAGEMLFEVEGDDFNVTKILRAYTSNVLKPEDQNRQPDADLVPRESARMALMGGKCLTVDEIYKDLVAARYRSDVADPKAELATIMALNPKIFGYDNEHKWYLKDGYDKALDPA